MISAKLELMLSFSLYSEEEIEGNKYICITIPDFDFFEDKEILLNELKQMKPYDFKIDFGAENFSDWVITTNDNSLPNNTFKYYTMDCRIPIGQQILEENYKLYF